MSEGQRQTDRYHRQVLLPGMGSSGQQSLARGHAMVVGCGALGCVAADLLVRAGVGLVTIIDRDVVELTNLQRQTLFDERDAREGAAKAEAAERRLRSVNSAVRVVGLIEDFAPDNADSLVETHPRPGVLVDCTDNFETRYLLNDVAVKHAVPLVYGGAVGTSGMAMTIIPGRTACLRCMYPDPPAPGSMPTCDTAGILAPASSMIAARQAADALRIVAGHASDLPPVLLSIDLWTGSARTLDLSNARLADCPCCGTREFEYLAGRGRSGTTVLCGRNSVQVSPAVQGRRIDLAALAARLDGHGRFDRSPSVLRGRLEREGEPIELTVFGDGRAIIGGTTDAARARAVYARYVGA